MKGEGETGKASEVRGRRPYPPPYSLVYRERLALDPESPGQSCRCCQGGSAEVMLKSCYGGEV